MRLLILFALFLLPVSASAEFVDTYGNPVFPAESYRQLPGGAAYRDTNGQIHYEYVAPLPPPSYSAPPLSPSMPSQPRQDAYEYLRDVTPGSSYRSDSISHDRVTPESRPGR